MSTEEVRVHSLTHMPYHPGCKCCVAARKRDHKHPRRDVGSAGVRAGDEPHTGAVVAARVGGPIGPVKGEQASADVATRVGGPDVPAEATATGASICADYFSPRDQPSEESVTALAVCDSQS